MASKLLVQALLIILSSSIATASSSSRSSTKRDSKRRSSNQQQRLQLQNRSDNSEEFSSALGYLKQVGRTMGCSSKPMICLDKRFKPAGPICCGWICVDVTRDVNHCGHCFHRCKYSRSCCQGRCKNLDRDVHNCGFCGRRCPKRTKCVFGMCGYGG